MRPARRNVAPQINPQIDRRQRITLIQAVLDVARSTQQRRAWLLSWTIFPLGARFRPPSDKLGARVARDILEDREARINLTADIFVPPPRLLPLLMT